MQRVGLQDRPVRNLEEECLGLKDYVESLSEFILKCETPLTVAIQGDWGSGKTSLMNMIMARIKDNEKIHSIWFNTWQYSQFGLDDELTLSLLSHFLDSLNAGADTKRLLASVLSSGFKKFMKVLPAVADTAAGELGKTFAEQAGKLISESDPAKEITKLKNSIEKAVANIVGINEDKRVVVFIDDLDRLLPEKAVELLEVFKLFLDIPGCVFILACDYQVISQGLKQKFRLGADELKGKSFFDKIIQLPFQMPVTQYDVDQYLGSLLERIGVEFDEKDLSVYRRLVDNSVGFNPRTMKRLFNSMLLLNEVAKRKQLFDTQDTANVRDKQRVLFGILCLQTEYEPVYNRLSKDIENEIAKLIDFAQNESGNCFDDDEELKEYGDTIGTEIHDDDRGTRREKLKEFLDAFSDAIQTDQNYEDISYDEVLLLKKMFRLSAITSLDYVGDTADRVTSSDMRDIGNEVIKDIKRRFREYFKIKYSREFTARSPRDADLHLRLPMNIDLLDLPRVNFDFLLNRDYMEFSLEGGKKAARDWTKWLDENCANDFRERTAAQQGNKFLILWKKEFGKDSRVEVRTAQFKDEVIKTLDLIVPKLFACNKLRVD